MYPDKTKDHFEYDAEGRLLSHVDALHRRTTWTYNEAGLIQQRLNPDASTLHYHWDKLGQLVLLRNENNSEASFKYDPVGRLVMETGFDKQITDYFYDNSSELPTRRLDGDRITHFEYDPMGRLVESSAGERGGKVWETETFAYDGNGRLLLAENKDCKLQWFYDLAGNNSREHQHFKYMQQPKVGPVWNQNARRERDEELGCGFTWFTWDGDTLATECRDREERGGSTTHYVFEPGTFVPVAQAMINSTLDLLPQPIYGDHYDIERDPVWQHKPTPTPADTFAWYQCDQLGTPMEVTDEGGLITWTGIYRAWGLAEENRSKRTGTEMRSPLRFQGQYYDIETKLHYNRYRYYEPSTGRFIGKDPIGMDGGLNHYTYAPNPVEWIDPLGLAKSKPSGTPKQAQRKVMREQAPAEITRIDAPEQDVPASQWHAHCPCGSGYNQDGSIHDKAKGEVTFSRKTIQWLNDHGWRINK
ncbi:hypothetical protein L483_06930 [Pseudomonas putida H8234]|nr:hypothetical protein L483_06930 [Pseudomonas putida H8234]